MRNRMMSALGAITLTVALGLLIGPPAGAQTPAEGRQGLQSQIDKYLRQHPDAYQTSPVQVAFDGGSVRVNFVPPGSSKVSTDPKLRPDLAAGEQSESLSPDSIESIHGCPAWVARWFCFYENANWGGRMLQFEDCPGTQFLTDYGFANQTTSWVNTKRLGYLEVYSSSAWLWHEAYNVSSANVGSANNDKAYYFTCFGQ